MNPYRRVTTRPALTPVAFPPLTATTP
ncbi:MAG: hypothetical protein RJA21_383, partial [Gemmatimonadota bacterium]